MKVTKRIKNTIKHTVRMIEIMNKGLDLKPIVPLSDDINEHGYIEMKDSDFVHVNNSLMCMGAYSTFHTTTGGLMDVPVIVTDEYFEMLSENGKTFIRCHELGHHAKHLDKIKSLGSLYTRNIEDEYEADAFAMEFMGKDNTLNALKEMRSITFIKSTNKEISQRIEKIKSL